MKTLLFLTVLSATVSSFADASLADNKKSVKCNDENELKLTLNSDRKSLKLKIRKDNFGTLPVLSTTEGNQNGARFVTYKTAKGELILSDEADTFIDDTQAYFLDCE